MVEQKIVKMLLNYLIEIIQFPFLMSLKAGSTGLNLTGADMVIHFDPWWESCCRKSGYGSCSSNGSKTYSL